MRTSVVQPGTAAPRSSAAPESVIRTVGLTKTFGSVEALKGIDLEVPERSIVGFLGPNGAGKTTAIKILLGLGKPTSGSATVFGMDSVADSLSIRARVGYLAQNPRFFDHMTARETLEFTARFFYAGPRDAVRDRVEDTLELVGLADKADRPTKGFSGGERQRLGIGQAQINHPDLLILDEPAAALDPLGRRDVLEVMERLRRRTTIFYSTHILDDVERVSDHVAILNRGEMVASVPTRQLLDGGCVYELAVAGDVESALIGLRSQPWVSDVVDIRHDGRHSLTVTVTNEEVAEARLLRSILDSDVVVSTFGRKKQNLEEAFLEIVNGAST